LERIDNAAPGRQEAIEPTIGEQRTMNCRTARKLVQARHEGTLAAERDHSLQEHVRRCPACSRIASQLDLAHKWLQDLPVSQPSDNFDWRLKLRLAQAEREPMHVPDPAPNRKVWTLQFALSTAAAALLVLATGIVFTYRQAENRATPEPSVVSAPGPSTWAPSQASQARVGWPRLVPVRAGAPLGPELNAASAPSILGEAGADTTFLDANRRGEPIRAFPVGY
jgi:hypothetical protein